MNCCGSSRIHNTATPSPMSQEKHQLKVWVEHNISLVLNLIEERLSWSLASLLLLPSQVPTKRVVWQECRRCLGVNWLKSKSEMIWHWCHWHIHFSVIKVSFALNANGWTVLLCLICCNSDAILFWDSIKKHQRMTNQKSSKQVFIRMREDN